MKVVNPFLAKAALLQGFPKGLLANAFFFPHLIGVVWFGFLRFSAAVHKDCDPAHAKAGVFF